METVRLKTLYEEASRKYPARAPKPNKRKAKKTGFYNVYLVYCGTCRQKFMFQYRYKSPEGKNKYISSINLSRLKEKMDKMGFVLKIQDKFLANETMNKFGGI